MSDLTRWIRPLAAIIVGLLLAGGTGLLYANANQSSDKYGLTAYFTKAIGLYNNSDVNILGVPVGKVTSVQPEGTRVKVTMEIDSRYRIVKSAETFAQIVPISVISDRYIQLGPIYQGEGDFLDDGDVLDTDITQIPAELDDVFKQLKKLLDAIEPGKEGEPGALGELIVQLNKTLKGRERDLQGTLIHGADLTSTLADADQDLGSMLENLDSLFGKLATRANRIGDLNENFALVMTALAESRSDLQGTLKNLGDMTTEIGDLATEHGDRLGKELRLAGKVTSSLLRHRESVEESLSWLPVVGKGVKAAYHVPPFSDIDVRDNANARLECELLDPLPDGPIKDALDDICRGQTGEPRARTATPSDAGDERVDDAIDCDKGIRKVKKQLRRLERVNLPDEALDEILRPMRKNLKRLKKECRSLGETIKDPSSILDGLPDLPDLDDLGDDLPGLSNLSGSAGGARPLPPADSKSNWEAVRDWLGGFFGFLGVSS